MKWMAATALVLALSGCADSYPTSSLQQGAQASRIRVFVGSPGAAILVDGRQLGIRSTAAFDLFNVEPGLRALEVADSNQIVFHQRVLVDPGATIDARVGQ